MFEEEWSNYWFEKVMSFPNPFIISIALNKNMTESIIKNTADKCPWKMYMMRPNFALDIDFLIKLYGKEDQWYHLANHPSLTWDHIKKYKITSDVAFIQLSKRDFITIDIIKKNVDLPWDWMALSANLAISLEDIINNQSLPWVWYSISLRKDLRRNFIYMNQQLPWWANALTINPYIHYDDPTKSENRIYIFSRLSQDTDLPLEYIEKYIDMPWHWDELSFNKNLTTEFIDKYICKRWNWTQLSQHNATTWELVQRYKDYPWDYATLSLNSNITMDIIETNLDKPWIWHNISYNPNLTFEFIEKHQDKPRNVGGFCANDFTLEKENFIRKRLQEQFSKSELKEELMRRLHRPDPDNPDKWVQRQIDLGFLDL